MVKTETIKEIVDRIVKKFHPHKIILFGSYAQGNMTEDSDVDLLIVGETNLPPQERFPAVCRALAEYPVSFDIVFKTPDEFRRRRSVINCIEYFAEKYGKIVYEQ